MPNGQWLGPNWKSAKRERGEEPKYSWPHKHTAVSTLPDLCVCVCVFYDPSFTIGIHMALEATGSVKRVYKCEGITVKEQVCPPGH